MDELEFYKILGKNVIDEIFNELTSTDYVRIINYCLISG